MTEVNGNGRNSKLFYFTTLILFGALSSSVSINLTQARASGSLVVLQTQVQSLQRELDQINNHLSSSDTRQDINEQTTKQLAVDVRNIAAHVRGVSPDPVVP